MLQLTGAVTSFTARKDTAVPMLVQLARGDCHDMVESSLRDILGKLWRDPQLDVAAATGALLATAMDLHGRLDTYQAYPGRLSFLCRLWHPHTYFASIREFVDAHGDTLDVGLSLALQHLARRDRTEEGAVAFLASRPVQAALESMFSAASVTSLDVERHHAQAKIWEAARLVPVGTAARNALLHRYARERQAVCDEVAAADREYMKSKFTSRGSLAWKTAVSRPVGLRYARGGGRVAPPRTAPRLCGLRVT